jgi:hypothetical protein
MMVQRRSLLHARQLQQKLLVPPCVSYCTRNSTSSATAAAAAASAAVGSGTPPPTSSGASALTFPRRIGKNSIGSSCIGSIHVRAGLHTTARQEMVSRPHSSKETGLWKGPKGGFPPPSSTEVMIKSLGNMKVAPIRKLVEQEGLKLPVGSTKNRAYMIRQLKLHYLEMEKNGGVPVVTAATEVEGEAPETKNNKEVTMDAYEWNKI